MITLCSLLSVVCCLLQVTRGGYISNGDFEGSYMDTWQCNKCTMARVKQPHNGQYSVMVSSRQNADGIATGVNGLLASKRVVIKAFIKFLNLPTDKHYDMVSVMIETIRKDGKHYYDTIANDRYIRLNEWVEIGADYHFHWEAKSYARVYLKIADTSVNYLVDDVSVVDLPNNSNWQALADDYIEKHRKSDITISLEDHPSAAKDLTVRVEQIRHEFAFGSAFSLGRSMSTDYENTEYQKRFYDLFEWAVTEDSIKWGSCEKTQGDVHLTSPFKAIDNLISRGIKIRAHNLFSKGRLPGWVKTLTKDELMKAFQKRIQDVVVPLKGKVEHWDINNENLHADTFERMSGDPNITVWMFEQAHKADPNAKLFLNDQDIIKNPPEALFALKHQSSFLQSAGAPLYGLGIQSHLWDPSHLPTMRYRLDELAKTGLPLWITELDYYNYGDPVKMANKYGQFLRLYFGHPAVEGVLVWGFWDKQHWRPHAALFNGHDVTINPSGQMFQDLIHKEWQTSESHSLSVGGNVHMRGFNGDYKISVLRGNTVLNTHNFTLSKNGASVKVSSHRKCFR
ncbi:hypothetical protein SNE40_001522 [Patella caerulea]|uniref:GH10 domain-containing protein n=1 Tax=Patella caerulea TaxID=87958 RepID=A0AAN8KJI4_PATCE